MFFNRRCCRDNMYGMNNMNCCNNMEREIVEPTITKCVEKEFFHEVPHVCPIHTHVINRHIYKHTYTPQYTCSEEDQVVNNDCGGCDGVAGNMFNNF